MQTIEKKPIADVDDEIEDRQRVLLNKLSNKQTKIAVIGLGRIGLPLALSFAYNGYHVTGVDISVGLSLLLKESKTPFYEPNLDRYLATALHEDKFYFTNDIRHTDNVDVIFITIGVDLDKNYHPVYTKLKVLLEQIDYRRDLLIVLRPTVSPGTMTDIVYPTIHKKCKKENALVQGLDFWVTYVPERLAEGKAIEELKSLPLIIGTESDFAFTYIAKLFQSLNPSKLCFKAKPNEAEFVKLFSNAYRYVNFALANQFAFLTAPHHVDVNRVIEMANVNYPRANIPHPGLVGGYCLSKDGFLLTQNPEGNFLSYAWRFNEFLPSYIVECARSIVREQCGANIEVHYQIWGITFKKDSDDMRLSPAWKLALLLTNYDERIMSVEPNLSIGDDYENITIQSAIARASQYQTCVIIAMNHKEFYNTNHYKKLPKDTIVIDIWNCVSFEAEQYLSNVYKFGRDF